MPGCTGDANLPIHPGVIRLELFVSNRPVGKPGTFDAAQQTSFVKVGRSEAPVIGAEVHAAATNRLCVQCGRRCILDPCDVSVSVPKRLRISILLPGTHFIEKHDAELIMGEISSGAITALLHDDDFETGGR